MNTWTTRGNGKGGSFSIQNGVQDAQRGPRSPRPRSSMDQPADARPPVFRTAPPGHKAPRSRTSRVLAAALFGGLTFGASALGAGVSKKKIWYRSLLKSRATPPSAVFAPVWTFLYGCIAYSGYRIWSQPPSRDRSRALGLWGAQMALNASWSPLFFGAHQPKASAVVAGAMVPAIAAYSLTARKIDRPAAALMLPYLVWSGFASYLNAQVVRKNAFRL
jgi:benzodiazapine receptor